MAEVRIDTARGVVLAGDLVRPVDIRDAVVIFSHGFLGDRRAYGWFDRLAGAYRRAGYATFVFDYSGCGDSGDDVVTIRHQAEDLRAVSAWLTDQGLARQAVHAHGFGVKVMLRALPKAVSAVVATAPSLASLDFDWTQIFSEDQLSQLSQTGVCPIPNDTHPRRESHLISKETLQDLSVIEARPLLRDLARPMLLLPDALSDPEVYEAACRANIDALPDPSTVITLGRGRDPLAAHIPELDAQEIIDVAIPWLTGVLPPR